MIYLDNAATTKMDNLPLIAMIPYMTEQYGNPSGTYSLAQTAHDAIEKARRQCAALINAEPSEIFFTSGATESNNTIIHYFNNNTIIRSDIEHPSMMSPCFGIGADKTGTVLLEELAKHATWGYFNTISVMFANNEIGTIQPIKEISNIAKESGLLFHTDATQAFGHIPIDVKAMGIDMLSASAHKIYGPKGVGLLYVRKGVHTKPLFCGGHQQNGMRAGTENVAGIVGFGAAAELAKQRMEEDIAHETALRDRLIKRVLSEIPGTSLNGSIDNRLPGNANFRFKGAMGEVIVLLLGLKGICASAGSACSTGTHEVSHVLKAIGLSDEDAYSSVRFTIGRYNRTEEIDCTVDALKEILEKLQITVYR